MTDLNGRQMLTQPLLSAAGTAIIDLKALPDGAYVLYLTDAATGARRSTHRVVKMQE